MQIATITTFPGPLKKTDLILERGYKRKTISKNNKKKKTSKISRKNFNAYKWLYRTRKYVFYQYL